MFTGIVRAVGKIAACESRDGDLRLVVDCGDLDLSAIGPGDSIAVNGACLTAVELDGTGFAADVSLETLARTCLGDLEAGSPVNLEPALKVGDALGGHLVSGHVDGIGTLLEMRPDARSIRYRFEIDAALERYIAAKGSVTVDGTSLTVNHVDGHRFDVNIVPHTQQQTVFRYYQPGSRVNIEVDIIARYLERLLAGERGSNADKERGMLETLIKSGFINHE
jgi:riboflavin synthase